MAAKFLPAGYEASIRSKLGVKDAELPDADINQRLILELAESVIIKRVPGYADITDDTDKINLEAGTVAYICYLLCPSMSRRLNTEVQTIDVKWKKDKIDWTSMADTFLAEYERYLTAVASVANDEPQVISVLGVSHGPAFTG